MKLKTAGNTDIGLKRRINEDSYLVEPELGLFVVADGMGGHKAGEVASSMIVKTMSKYWTMMESKKIPAFLKPIKKDISDKAKHLLNSLYMANLLVHEAQKKPEYHKMGSTVSAVLVEDNAIWIANVGDSPVYLFSDDNLKLISEEHSIDGEWKSLGLDELGSTNPGMKNTLTRVIGLEKNVDVFIAKIIPGAGDKLLMCSDGLINYVSEDIIRGILNDSSMSLEIKVEVLIEEANKGGGGDNITAILIDILEESRWERIKQKFKS